MSVRSVMDSLLGDDDSAEADDTASDDGGSNEGSFGDESSEGEFGAFGEGDDLDGMDDGDLGGDLDVDALENRLDEVEAELEDLASTVETVRTENEQISASVGDVEENVRKLLDIYEMVTKGVNPFADDVDAGLGGGSSGDFGLFEDDPDDGDAEEETIDQDVADADPEGFFDEDLDDEDLMADSGTESATAADDDGTSFEDLKAEYDGSDGRASDAGETDVMEGTDGPADDTGEPVTTEDRGSELVDSTDRPDAERFDGEPQSQGTASEGKSEADQGASTRGRTQVGTNGDEAPETDLSPGANGFTSTSGGKPYLMKTPGGYQSDLVVAEWLEFLVSEAGVSGAARALEYYEAIAWIDSGVADRLTARLAGFENGGDGRLEIEDHAQSLRYIGQLSGREWRVADLAAGLRGGDRDGIQR